MEGRIVRQITLGSKQVKMHVMEEPVRTMR